MCAFISMRQLFPQLVAIFLVSCLIADPSSATTLSLQQSSTGQTFGKHFDSQSIDWTAQALQEPEVAAQFSQHVSGSHIDAQSTRQENLQRVGAKNPSKTKTLLEQAGNADSVNDYEFLLHE